MNQTRTRCAKLAFTAFAAVPILAGCQQPKVVARINSQTITEEEFNNRVQRVRATSFPQEFSTDAGGVTLLNMIQSSIIDQCAAEPNLKAVPSDETLKSYVSQVLRMFPDLVNRIKQGEMTPEELTIQVKSRLEMLAIGTDGAKPDDTELQKMYEELKSQHAADYPALYTIRFITLPDMTQAKTFLDSVKKSGDFKAAAAVLNIPPETAVQLGRTTVVAQKQLPPKVTAVLDTLKAQEFTPEPVEFTTQDPNNPQAGSTTTKYMVAQLVSKEASKTPTMQEIHAQLSQMALEKKFPQWNQHAAQRIADYTEKAKIEILIDRYKPLVASVIIPSAKRSAAAASMGAAGAPTGAPAQGAPMPGASQ